MVKKTVESVNVNTFKMIEKAGLTLVVEGDTSLIVHAWSEKAKKMMLDKQQKKAGTGHEIRDPGKEFIESLYWLEGKPDTYDMASFNKAIKKGAQFGFPSIAFKAAACAGGYRAGMTKDKVSMYGAFHILGDYVVIEGIPEMREDMVRLSGMGSPADLRYRGEFKKWKAMMNIVYNKNAISVEQIASLFSIGGFAVGVGENRPEKGGVNGQFHVTDNNRK